MQEISTIMMALIRYELGEELGTEIKRLITVDKLLPLFKLSKRHDLAHLVGDALERNGLLMEGTEDKTRFLQERNMALYRYEQIQYEFDCICRTLEEAKIVFIPLKGAVIRNLYPQPWMRTSCDIDIMVKKDNLQETIDLLKKELSYRDGGIGPYDANLYSESGVHLELRYNPSAVSERTREVLSTIWDNVLDKDAHHLDLTNEMFYFYHLEHMAGHFKVGGCGVRFFLDVHILNKTLTYNRTLKQKFLQDAGLKIFADAIEKTANYWFKNEKLDETIKQVENYVLNSGIYGCMEHRVAIKKNNKGRLKFILSRLFLPYGELKFQYPQLKRFPILFPFYQVRRWFNLLRKERRKQAVNELKITVTEDKEKEKKVAQLLNNLGI